MEEKELRYSLEGMRRISPGSYASFVDYGDHAIEVLEEGSPGATRFAAPSEIYEETITTCISFTSIINLLAEAEILPAWNSSKPYRVDTENYEIEDVEEALSIVREKGKPLENYESPIDSPSSGPNIQQD